MRYRLFQFVLVAFGIFLGVAVVVPSWLFSLTSTQAINLGGVRIALIPFIAVCFVLAVWVGRQAGKQHSR